jgi:hypothetical protein
MLHVAMVMKRGHEPGRLRAPGRPWCSLKPANAGAMPRVQLSREAPSSGHG